MDTPVTEEESHLAGKGHALVAVEGIVATVEAGHAAVPQVPIALRARAPPDDPDGPPHTETWMINEPWPDYKTKVVDNSPTGPDGPTGNPTFHTFEID